MMRTIDMSDDEFSDYLIEKQEAVRRQAAEIIARENEPRGFASRRKWEKIVLALVMVKDRETLNAWRASTDGNDGKAVSIPKSVIEIVMTEADGLFVVAIMKAWVAIDRHMKQANNPQLVASVEWTDEQKKAWQRICARTRSIRETLTPAARRRPNGHPSRKPMFSRSDCA
jgi:hypothetical protein